MPLPSIQLSGTVVFEPSLRFTPSGSAVVSFRVACNQRKKTDAGGWVDGDSCFLDVTAWQEKAEAIAEQVKQGDRVVVTGTLKMREYTDKDENKRQAFEVNAFDVALIVRPPKAERDRPKEPPANDPWSQPAESAPPW